MSDTPLFRIGQLCIALEQPHTKESLKNLLVRAGEIFCCTHYLVGISGALRTTRTPIRWAVCNFDPAYQERYDAENLIRVDPYFRYATTHWGPFRWDAVAVDEKGEIVRQALRAQGMEHGMICTAAALPYMGLAMFAGPVALPRDSAWNEIALALNLFACAATRAAIAIVEKANPAPAPVEKKIELKGNERLVIELAAQGKTYAQIAERVQISVSTVRYHLARVAGKLDVATTKAAVAEAIARGLIHQRHFDEPKFKGVAQ